MIVAALAVAVLGSAAFILGLWVALGGADEKPPDPRRCPLCGGRHSKADLPRARVIR